MPRVTPGYEPPSRASSSGGGCTVVVGTAAGGTAWFVGLALAAGLRRRSRPSRR